MGARRERRGGPGVAARAPRRALGRRCERRGGLRGRRRASRSPGAAARTSRRSPGRQRGRRGDPGGTARASERARGGSVRASSGEPDGATDVVSSSEDWGGGADVNGSGWLGFRN